MLRKTIIAVVAILAITGGTATAAKLITGKNVKNESLTGKDIKNGSLGAKELSSAARASLKGQTGAAGATGATGASGAAGAKGETGAKGDKGDKGDRGPSNAFGVSIESASVVDSGGDPREIIGTTLPAGAYVLNAKFTVENTHAVDINKPDCTLGFVFPENQLFIPIDHAAIEVGSLAEETNDALYVLTGVVQLDDPSTGVAVRCNPTGDTYKLTFRDRQLNAIQVATLDATP